MRKTGFDIRVVTTHAEFLALRQRWDSLVDGSPCHNFFLRWAWLHAWWENYRQEGFRLSIILAFKEDCLAAIAPLYTAPAQWKKIYPVRRLMFLGTAPGSIVSEYMDIIAAPGLERDATRAIFEFVINENLCDEMVLHKLNSSSGTGAVLEEIADEMRLFHSAERSETPYISLPSDFETFMSRLNPSTRHRIRNNQRKLERCGNVQVRMTSNESEFEADFSELVRLHRLRWEPRRIPCSFSKKSFHDFQKSIMMEILKTGHLRLWFLAIGGRNIAALYNIQYGSKIFYYQSGLDADYSRALSPGLILHSHCIREGIGEGVKEYDFLLQGKTDAYKKKWTNRVRYQTDLYIAKPGLLKLASLIKGKAGSILRQIS